jgi:hypothetical protein
VQDLFERADRALYAAKHDPHGHVAAEPAARAPHAGPRAM